MMTLFILLFVSIFSSTPFDVDIEMLENGEYRCELREGEEMFENECLLCEDIFDYMSWVCLGRVEVTFLNEETGEEETVDTLKMMVRKRLKDPSDTIFEGAGKFDRVIYFPSPEEADTEFKLSIEGCNLFLRNAATDEVVTSVTEILVGELGTGEIPEGFTDCYISVCQNGMNFFYEGYLNRLCWAYDSEKDDPYSICISKPLDGIEEVNQECVENLDYILTNEDFE